MKKYFLFISLLVISIAEANTGPITPAEIDQMMNDPEGFKITQAINKLSYDAKQKELAKKSEVKIGMTQDQVLNKSKWGEPQYRRTLIDKSGKFDTWIYGIRKHFIFKNDELVSIQY